MSFLQGANVAGPMASFLANGVAGADFFDMSEKTLTTDLRLSLARVSRSSQNWPYQTSASNFATISDTVDDISTVVEEVKPSEADLLSLLLGVCNCRSHALFPSHACAPSYTCTCAHA